MGDLLFEVVYLAGIIIALIIGHLYTRTARRRATRLDRRTTRDVFLQGLAGTGMIVLPLIHLATPILDFANFSLPLWMGWSGTALFGSSLWLFWKAHADLGDNWSIAPRIIERHTVVEDGVYRYMRHPMYAAHWIWGVAQVFLIQNWIAGPAFLIAFYPFYRYRVPVEEQMMLDQFGRGYRTYMERTGRIFPQIPWLMRILKWIGIVIGWLVAGIKVASVWLYERAKGLKARYDARKRRNNPSEKL